MTVEDADFTSTDGHPAPVGCCHPPGEATAVAGIRIDVCGSSCHDGGGQ